YDGVRPDVYMRNDLFSILRNGTIRAIGQFQNPESPGFVKDDIIYWNMLAVASRDQTGASITSHQPQNAVPIGQIEQFLHVYGILESEAQQVDDTGLFVELFNKGELAGL